MAKAGFLGGAGKVDEKKRNRNKNLLLWLEEEGGIYLKDESSWTVPPHPLAVSTETYDESTNESTGRGILARRPVNQGDELLTVPLSLCMTKDSAIDYLNEGKGGGRKFVDVTGRPLIAPGTNEYLAIAVFIIYERYVRERVVGSQSFWKPYLDVLPEVEDVSCTFTWTDDDLSALEGSPVIAATRSMQMKLRKEHDIMINDPKVGILSRFPGEFQEDDFSYDRWLWAFTILFSRAIRVRNLKEGEAVALVPYADLINHSPFSQAFIDARQMGDWLFKTGEEEIILYADRGYRRMEQVYISYGQKSNSDLLLLYGFALERNPFNSVDVSVGIEVDGDGDDADLLNEKLSFLKKVGRDGQLDFPIYFDRYPMEMLEYLRLMFMTRDDLGGKSLQEFDYSRTISSANEAAVLSSIIFAIKSQISKYPTTEKEDEALISDKGLFKLFSKNQRMAVRHRRNEKRLLKRTVAALQKEMKNRGLDQEEGLSFAQGRTAGVTLKGDEKKFLIAKGRTALEERLEKMGLPVDIR